MHQGIHIMGLYMCCVNDLLKKLDSRVDIVLMI